MEVAIIIHCHELSLDKQSAYTLGTNKLSILGHLNCYKGLGTHIMHSCDCVSSILGHEYWLIVP